MVAGYYDGCYYTGGTCTCYDQTYSGTAAPVFDCPHRYTETIYIEDNAQDEDVSAKIIVLNPVLGEITDQLWLHKIYRSIHGYVRGPPMEENSYANLDLDAADATLTETKGPISVSRIFLSDGEQVFMQVDLRSIKEIAIEEIKEQPFF